MPWARWAVLSSGLKYLVIYMPRSTGRPVLYCSPVMDFCLEPDSPCKNVVPQVPPIWSMLVYMWLTETVSIDDEVLMQQLGLPDPATDTPSSNVESIHGHMCPESPKMTDDDNDEKSTVHSGNPAEVRRIFSFSFTHAANDLKFLQPPGNLLVQYLDTHPITVTPVDRNKPQSEHALEEHPFVHLDLKVYYFAGARSVYVSTKSHVMVKFAYYPDKDKAELERMLTNERAAHNKLQLLAGWAIPRCYGEYLWYGGRALVLSHEGPSFGELVMEFRSLGREERCDLPRSSQDISLLTFLSIRRALFGNLCLIHYLGVFHGDFDEWSVVRTDHGQLKIVNFGSSDVSHVCPGWRKCSELQSAWSQLQLDRVEN